MQTNKDQIKIVFFGTSDKSEAILDALKNFSLNDTVYSLALCITKADTKVGRNQEIRETKVKQWAKHNNIEFLEILDMKSEAQDLIVKKIAELEIDIGVVADFNYIISRKVFEALPYQIINIHFSRLPKYRGASPVQHAIINGDKTTAITYQLIDAGMDTGDIVFQRDVDILETDTTESLYLQMFDKASKDLPNIIHQYMKKDLIPKPQDHALATYCYSPTRPKSTYIYKEDAQINWVESAKTIERKIRAFYPWPIAHTTLGEMHNHKIINLKPEHHKNTALKVKIYKAKLENSTKKLSIETIQIEGKNKTGFDDFLRGYCTETILKRV